MLTGIEATIQESEPLMIQQASVNSADRMQSTGFTLVLSESMSTADSEEPGSLTHDRREPSEEPASLSHDRRKPSEEPASPDPWYFCYHRIKAHLFDDKDMTHCRLYILVQFVSRLIMTRR
ncbi:hypothetical protein DPMN_166335 [Dreissena polymorpha]|uniref:Uncharacterized protein n=1 Tax=Dreissena polymorpha TaxID=45954 RepID=A0A9D4EXT2_DREPO|nr:hypothetical protein DPMN_166335 [Dreissena polymorpha]